MRAEDSRRTSVVSGVLGVGPTLYEEGSENTRTEGKQRDYYRQIS